MSTAGATIERSRPTIGAHWFRVPTTFDGGEMTVEQTPERDSIYYAYFEPYSWERHLDLLGRAESSPLARVRRLGSTVEGRDFDVVTVGAAGARQAVAVGHRPAASRARRWPSGSSKACSNGCSTRSDPVARALLERAVVHIVPNMNPDGSVRGNLRTNAAGANLNREWMAPTLERSPEVLPCARAMHETGVDALARCPWRRERCRTCSSTAASGCRAFHREQDALQKAFVDGVHARRAPTSSRCTAIPTTRRPRST